MYMRYLYVNIYVYTYIAAGAAALGWMITEWGIRKQPSILGMINGAIAGLVCITPAAGFVDTTGAFFIGFFGGPLCLLGSKMKHYFGFDDALDAFGIHAIGGTIGGLATGFFATDKLIATGWGNQAGIPITGVYYGGLEAGGHQLAIQLVGVLFTIAWSFIWTYCILQIIDKTIGLRYTRIHIYIHIHKNKP
jgi:Amt family ammonium transporter